ncbi:protein rolling stone-like [Euwallacea fornicatus]|uniref:protein rolling stone-like n=1 Tax=Euwallacea fornicatus TaxID=995702 RepID=UPI00338E4D0E
MGFWKDTFDPSNFLPFYPNPNIFTVSEWQRNKDITNLIYLILRLVHFVAFLVILILSYTKETEDGKHKWWIYLTNWGLTFCTFQSFLSCLMIICTLLGAEVFDKPLLVQYIQKLYPLYWVINVIATTVAFTISIVYWSLIHRPEYWSTLNFCVHGMNSILMFLDFCAVGHPVRLLHFYYPIIFTMIYVSMTAIYYSCGGTAKGGEKYIYPILKWDEPLKTLGYCGAIVILISVIHGVTFFMQLGKSKIANIFFGTSAKNTPEDIDAADQML